MEYAIGQTIVHPAHGAGKIINVEKITLGERPQAYYVLRFANQELTVRVPMRRVSAVGLRQIMSKEKVKQVLATLRAAPKQLPQDYKKRRKALESLVFSGYPVKIAQAVRELTWRRRDKKHLGIEDQRLLEHGRDLLVHEMALALEHDLPATVAVIDDALATAVDSGDKQE